MTKKVLYGIMVGIFAIIAVSAKAQTVLVLSSEAQEYQAIAAGFRSAFSGDFQEFNLEGSDEKQRAVGKKLQAGKPAVAVVVGDLAAQMAKWYLEDVPVVYCDAIRAAKISLVSGKTTGIYHEPNPVEQLKIMHKLFPDKTRIGLVYCPEYARVNESDVKNKSRALGISLEIAVMGSIKEVPVKLRELMPRVDLLWVFTDPVTFSSHSIQYLVLQSISAGIPIFCGDKTLAHSGATAALIPDMDDAGRKAATEAKKALQGSGPRGNIIYPKGKLVLNQKTASILKVSFPPSMVGQAEEVIQEQEITPARVERE